jgi:hypothetical protein
MVRGVSLAVGVAAAFMLLMGDAPSAPLAGCNEACAAAKEILKSRGNNFRSIASGFGPPHYQCKQMRPDYVCRIYAAPQASAEASFSSTILGFRAAEPRWKWFRATNARYQGPGEVQIYGGPSRSHYAVTMWLARRGKDSTTDFTVSPNAEDTMFDVVPCQGSCLSP